MPEHKYTHRLIRLNRYIANAGVCTRREADQLIKEGKIRVNGEVVTQLGTKVSRTDTVQWDNKKLQARRRFYVLLNKPKGFIATVKNIDDPRHVMQLVKTACKERIYPVGQLDREDTGLLLFTNDGELTKKLMASTYKKEQVFQVQLNEPLQEKDLEKIKKGIRINGELIEVPNIRWVKQVDKSVVGIEILSHKNRVVKRIFQSLGYKVARVDRVLYLGLTKKNLKRGHWRMLTEKEVRNIKFF
ncbi:pseudouridine synthase [Balneicella halophila]|nr:pseudouridine synthase [Balneicella halophila]